MSVETDMVTLVVTDGGVQELMGSRFFAVYVPQGQSYPAMVYEPANDAVERTLGGQHVQEEAVYAWRILAATFDEVLQVKAAVKRLAGRGYGLARSLSLEEGPADYDFEAKLFFQVLIARVSVGG